MLDPVEVRFLSWSMSSKTGSSVSPACAYARIERLSLLQPMVRYSEKLPFSSRLAQVERYSIASVSALLSAPTNLHPHLVYSL